MATDPRDLASFPALMIAGPGELHDEDLALHGRQVIAHYGDAWVDIHQDAVAMLGRLMGCTNPYLIPGSGSTCLDAAVANLFRAGERVVVANTGFFGVRLIEVARAHQLDVVEVDVEVGEPVDVERIADALPGTAGALTVHVDTATGVRQPIEEIARAVSDAGGHYVVDGIASVGGELLDVEGMGIDVVVTSTQKGLEAPPGLGIVALSRRGRERVASLPRPRSWYLDLRRWDWYRAEWGAWHPHPVTMPTTLVLALASSLRRILDIGLQGWVARRAELAKRCREGLRDAGLEPVAAPGAEANLVVAMWADEPAVIQRYLLEKESIMISGGLSPTMGRAIRVGLMGRTATEDMVDRVVAAVAAALDVAPRAPEPPA